MFAKTLAVFRAVGCGSLLLWACTTERVVSGGPGTGIVPPGSDAEAGDAAAAAVAASPREECERYLDCINQKDPTQGGTTVALYGDDSACWKGSLADARRCGDACRTARTAIPRPDGKYPKCGCETDAECPNSFCAKDHFCASSEVGEAYKLCKAATPAIEQLAKGSELGAGPGDCLSVVGADCEGWRTLDVREQDPDGVSVRVSSLVKAYTCMTGTMARLRGSGQKEPTGSCQREIVATMCDDQSVDGLIKTYPR